jgi:nicotinamidase-related amidase
MLMNQHDSCLVVIDVQEKLTPLIHDHERLVNNCAWCCELAQALTIPIVYTEQYPSGLGPTLPRLTQYMTSPAPAKLHFSCASDESCLQQIRQTGRQQLVLIGIEAHVCVLQSALELKDHGFDVFVVEDAISSRNIHDAFFAKQRMQQHNIELVTKEMVFFEWLRVAGTPQFKALSKKLM